MLFELSFQFDMKIKMASTLCTHYHRKCQIKVSSFNSLILEIVNMYLLSFQTSCCNEVFGCLQCHNEIQSHKAKLKDIKALICLNCKYQHDGITNICVQCDTQFGEVRILIHISPVFDTRCILVKRARLAFVLNCVHFFANCVDVLHTRIFRSVLILESSEYISME